jgi:hypothetical protein
MTKVSKNSSKCLKKICFGLKELQKVFFQSNDETHTSYLIKESSLV